MMMEEILLILHSVKCPLKEDERATADDWRDAHRLGNKLTDIDIDASLHVSCIMCMLFYASQ